MPLAQRAVLLAVLALAAWGPLGAQSRVEGRVVSAVDGRPVAAAEVLLEASDTLRVRTDEAARFSVRVRADDAGRFSVAAPSSGSLRLRVRAMGFVAYSDERHVHAGESLTWDVSLAPAALSLDQMVVTAARREQRLGDAVTTVEVVNRADLERTGAADLSAVLIEHTGIELQGGHPAGSGVMLQGIGSERVLILLDGQPLAGRLSGNFDVSRIPVAMVERVEVVKGAQSTLYGSEAMGGVVNIITRTAPQESGMLGGNITATAGQQGRRDGAGRLTFARGSWSVAGDLARRYVETAPGIEGEDGALAARLDGAMKLRWAPDTTRSAEFNLLALDERQRWRTGTFFGFSDNVQLNARAGASLRVGRHRFAPGLSVSNWDHTARSSAFSLPVAGDTGQRQLQRIVQGELIYAGSYSQQFKLDAGVQVRVDEIEAERVPGGLRRHTSVEPFAQAEWAATSWLTVTPGARVSQSNQWGTQFTPRVAARARVTDRLTLRASVGDGFRAPDFKELFLFFQNTNAGYAVQGNPDLRPENSRSAMFGAEWATASGYVRAQLFNNAFENFIETQIVSGPSEAPVYEYQNRDNGYTRGVEFETGGNLLRSGRLRGELGWSLLQTRDESTGRELLGRPSQSARAALQMTLPWLTRMSVAAIHTGRTPMQRDTDTGDISEYRDAFTHVDLRVARALPVLGLEFVLGADNVFDQRPAEWAGFTGRHVYTSLSYSFNQPVVR